MSFTGASYGADPEFGFPKVNLNFETIYSAKPLYPKDNLFKLSSFLPNFKLYSKLPDMWKLLSILKN